VANKTELLQIRLKASEKRWLAKVAAAEGLSLSAWARRRLFAYAVVTPSGDISILGSVKAEPVGGTISGWWPAESPKSVKKK
jgi:hypothetical protein